MGTKINKAIGGALVAFGGALSTAALDGGVSGTEWWGILGATCVTFGTVWRLPNKSA